MSLTKVNYIDNSTIITAKNLNDIQDNIIQNAELIKKAAPRNLLDNSDFRNPVNQRGQMSYSLLQGEYCIDRWMPLNVTGVKNTVELTDNGIIFGNENNETVFLTQRFEKKYLDKTKTYTPVECFENGTISFGGYIDYSNTDFDIVNLTFPANTKIKWVALYEGEYTIDTVPEYQPKGYGAELAECRRYFRPSVIYNMVCHYPGYLIGAHLEVPMRINPTITVTSTHTGKWEEVSGTTEANFGDGGISTVKNTNFTVGNWYRVGLELNADF